MQPRMNNPAIIVSGAGEWVRQLIAQPERVDQPA